MTNQIPTRNQMRQAAAKLAADLGMPASTWLELVLAGLIEKNPTPTLDTTPSADTLNQQ